MNKLETWKNWIKSKLPVGKTVSIAWSAVLVLLALGMAGLLFVPGYVEGMNISRSMMGLESEAIGAEDAPGEYAQTFRALHEEIRMVSVVVHKNGTGGAEDKFMHWRLVDGNGHICYEGEVPYAELEDKRFTEIPVEWSLKALRKYAFVLSFDEVGGVYPTMVVNHGAEEIPESSELRYNGELQEQAAFVWTLQYEQAYPWEILLGILFVLTALLVTIPLRKRAGNKTGWILAGAGILFVPFGMVYAGELMIDGPSCWLDGKTFLYNVLFCYLGMLALFLFSCSVRFTLRLGAAAVALLYLADFYILKFRDVPFKIASLTGIGTAQDVAAGYDYAPGIGVLLVLLCLLLVWCLPWPGWLLAEIFSKQEQGEQSRQKYKGLLVQGVCIVIGLLYVWGGWSYLMNSEYLNSIESISYRSGVDNAKAYRASGFLAATLLEVKNTRILPPEGYSEKQVEALLASYDETARQEAQEKGFSAEDAPHIIMILNESFADLSVLGEENLAEQTIPVYTGLSENAVKGYVNMSTIGGGTANSEFEVLTGFTDAFLPADYYPFSAMISSQTDSLIWQLRDLGYRTYAMHPEAATNWNRSSVYPLLGVEQCFWDEDFEGKPRRHHGVTDYATYEKIIEIYENRAPGEKLFIYDVTMQNHGGYNKIDVENVFPHEKDSVSEYLSLVRYSDEDLGKLLEYLRQQEEKIVLCFYGDHQPKLEDSYYRTMAEQTGLGDGDNLLLRYKTPFVIWANYELPAEEGYDIGMNQLGNLLFEKAGIPLSGRMKYLTELSEKYPVITQNLICDAEGNRYSRENLPEELQEFNSVQYYFFH